MQVPFSQRPGRHERHLRRRLNHPFFPGHIADLTDEILLEAQRKDHEELVAYIEQLRRLVLEAVNLPPNTGSEALLDLKDRLDQSYLICVALADDQEQNLAAIRDLAQVIMDQIQRQAGPDSLANLELATEAAARQAHYETLSTPFVADLLHPDCCIEADEFSASMAAESREARQAALGLFDENQLVLILKGLEELANLWPQEPKVKEALVDVRARIEGAQLP